MALQLQMLNLTQRDAKNALYALVTFADIFMKIANRKISFPREFSALVPENKRYNAR